MDLGGRLRDGWKVVRCNSVSEGLKTGKNSVGAVYVHINILNHNFVIGKVVDSSFS